MTCVESVGVSGDTLRIRQEIIKRIYPIFARICFHLGTRGVFLTIRPATPSIRLDVGKGLVGPVNDDRAFG